MQNELVSIITPMYNASCFVAQSIESVLAQTYPHWEMLIVNDGSKDNSAEIVLTYAKKDFRIKLINQVNAGSAAARNNALRNVSGKYICFLDSDDLWTPYLLEEQLKFMHATKAMVVTASYDMIDEAGKKCLNPYIVPKSIKKTNLLKINSMSCLTTIYNAEALGVTFFKENLKSFRDDLNYWIDILEKAKIAFGNPRVLASYRVFQNSTTGNKRKIVFPHFMFLYTELKLGFLRSLYYTFIWAIHGILKYRKNIL